MSDPLFVVGQVFASPSRIAVLSTLVVGTGTVSEVAGRTGRSEIAVRRHLERLEALGVVERVPPETGRTLMFRVCPQSLRRLAEAVAGLCSPQ